MLIAKWGNDGAGSTCTSSRRAGRRSRAEELRLEIYEKVNALGIGAQGLGGLSTVLDVKVNDFPRTPRRNPWRCCPTARPRATRISVLDGSGPAKLDPPSLDDWPKLTLDFARAGA
jgi:fumarate hydratase class I